jgi:mannose-1-phosphate guanylyltransferase
VVTEVRRGLHDMIVLSAVDVTMICPRDGAEWVKELVAAVREHHGEVYS